MGYIVSTFGRILGVLALLVFFAGPLRADPTVIFGPGTGGTAVTDLNANPLGTIGEDRTLTIVLRNSTNFTFWDFHFTSGTQQQLWTGNGGVFFSVVSPSPGAAGISFFRGGGFGIAPTTSFTVMFRDFQPGSVITGQASIPEPTTMLLLGTGLAGIAIRARKKLKRHKIQKP